MFLVCLHPEHTTPWVSEVPVMEDEARCIMAQRRRDLEADPQLDGGALTRSGSIDSVCNFDGDVLGGGAFDEDGAMVSP